MTPQTGDKNPHALTHYMCMCMQPLGSGGAYFQIMYNYYPPSTPKTLRGGGGAHGSHVRWRHIRCVWTGDKHGAQA